MATYTNYLGRYGKTQLWKFGETMHANQRLSAIRNKAQKDGIRSANNYKFIEISNMANSKAEALLVESTVRKVLESKGYKLEKNDHFRTNKKAGDVLADYHEALAKAARILAIASEA